MFCDKCSKELTLESAGLLLSLDEELSKSLKSGVSTISLCKECSSDYILTIMPLMSLAIPFISSKISSHMKDE